MCRSSCCTDGSTPAAASAAHRSLNRGASRDRASCSVTSIGRDAWIKSSKSVGSRSTRRSGTPLRRCSLTQRDSPICSSAYTGKNRSHTCGGFPHAERLPRVRHKQPSPVDVERKHLSHVVRPSRGERRGEPHLEGMSRRTRLEPDRVTGRVDLEDRCPRLHVCAAQAPGTRDD